MTIAFGPSRALMGALALSVFGLASPALAQQDEVYQTPSGPLRLIETDDLEVEIHLGDQVFPYAEGMRAYVLERVGDVFLVFLATGGNACPGYFVWLDTKKDAAFASEAFGTCSDLYQLTQDQDVLTLTVPSMVPGEGDHEYVWDGEGQLSETVLPLQASSVPPGADPLGWLGRHPAELLDSSDWEALMLNVLTPEQLDEIRTTATMSGGFEAEGDWVAAYAWDKLSDAIAAIALHPDGELLVALGARGQVGQLWGETAHPYPPAIQMVLDGE